MNMARWTLYSRLISPACKRAGVLTNITFFVESQIPRAPNFRFLKKQMSDEAVKYLPGPEHLWENIRRKVAFCRSLPA